jgi:hypothetical protein
MRSRGCHFLDRSQWSVMAGSQRGLEENPDDDEGRRAHSCSSEAFFSGGAEGTRTLGRPELCWSSATTSSARGSTQCPHLNSPAFLPQQRCEPTTGAESPPLTGTPPEPFMVPSAPGQATVITSRGKRNPAKANEQSAKSPGTGGRPTQRTRPVPVITIRRGGRDGSCVSQSDRETISMRIRRNSTVIRSARE